MIIKVIQVGELGVNCYIASCPETKECLVIDPGAEVEMIFKYIAEAKEKRSGDLGRLTCKLRVSRSGYFKFKKKDYL